MEDKLVEWAIKIQALSQNGLAFCQSDFDKERYEELRNISAEMLSYKTDLPIEKVKDLFCNETGYQTPKVDTRAVVFQDNKILLVHEKDNGWSLPGGYCDVLQSVKSNTIKEAKEEAGVDVLPKRIIAIQDRNKHLKPKYAESIFKIFVLCDYLGGEYQENIETTETGYFTLEDLPPLMESKCTKEQLQMCFDAYQDENWEVQFD